MARLYMYFCEYETKSCCTAMLLTVFLIQLDNIIHAYTRLETNKHKYKKLPYLKHLFLIELERHCILKVYPV